MIDTKLSNIINILVEEIAPEKLILFGSRGKGKETYNSDYDIAVDSNLVNFRKKRQVKEKIEEIIGLHKVDLIFLKEVDKEFTNIILSTGKVIYER